MTGQKFAVFDIDGTLIRWQLTHAIVDRLAKDKQLNSNAYQQIKAARLSWKNRADTASFQAYERVLIDIIDDAMSHIRVADFNQACQAVIVEYRDQVYRYTRDLIKELKARDYMLFAISASQQEIIKPIAEYYGFDDYGGSKFEVKDGHFTGEKAILAGDQKPEVLRQLVAKHGATWQSSLGIGDSESDIPMLETVEHAVAFNPTRELFDHARQNHWKVVVERKNVIYELEAHGSHYQLQA